MSAQAIGSTVGSKRSVVGLQESGIVIRSTQPTADEIYLLLYKTQCPICLLPCEHKHSHHLTKCEHCDWLVLSLVYNLDNNKHVLINNVDKNVFNGIKRKIN